MTEAQIATMQAKAAAMTANDRTQALLNHMGAMRVEAAIANAVKTSFAEAKAADMNRRGVTIMQRHRNACYCSTVLRSGYWIN